MKRTDETIEIQGQTRQEVMADYSEADARGLVGNMVKSKAELDVYGKITGVQGFEERDGAKKQYFGVVVEWNIKPKPERSTTTVLFRTDIDRHYPLTYGAEMREAKAVWDMAKQSQQTTHNRRRGR